jgi:hypothetical protein
VTNSNDLTLSELKRWAEIMNKGYAGQFNYNTAKDKAIVELGTCQEWCRSIAAEFGLNIGEPEPNLQDPPDCTVLIEGKSHGVELVQLIDSEHKLRSIKGESPYYGKLFLDMQWSRERFISKVNKIIQKKSEKYHKNKQHIDVLVIHTDETWLTSSQARQWLRNNHVKQVSNITNVYLLFTYDPSWHDHWPVLCIYGGLDNST